MLKPLSICVLAITILAACGGGAAPATPQAGSPAASAKPASAAASAASASAKPAASAAAKPSAASQAAEAGQLRSIKMAVPTKGSAFSYLYLARDLGFFRKHGLDAQINVITPANAVTALQSGDLDFASTVGSTI